MSKRELKIVKCSICNCFIRSDRLSRHLQKVHGKRQKSKPVLEIVAINGKKLVSPQSKATQPKLSQNLSAIAKKRASKGRKFQSPKYPLISCRKCGEEVFSVPENRGSRVVWRKYDRNPFAPHSCDTNLDPLDMSTTIRIFNPRNNPYR